MKRSARVMLVLSGAILTGCSRREPEWTTQGNAAESSQGVTNNTYVAGRGYYHAPYFGFFPFPYNSFVPGRGYYHGGRYSQAPDNSPVVSSSPHRNTQPASRGGFSRSSSRVGSVYS